MDHAPPPPSPGIAAAITAGLVPVIAGFIALGMALGLEPLYGGFTLLWYHATVDKLDLRVAPSAVAGAVAGVGVAWALQAATATGNPSLALIVLGIIMAAVFFQIQQRLSFVINGSFMLFLTVSCAPLIQKGEDFREVIASIVLGAVYFGAILGGMAWLASRRQQAGSAKITST